MTQNIFRATAAIVLTAFVLAASACGGSNPPKSADDVIAEYAEMIIKGDNKWGDSMSELTAGGFDASTNELTDVRLENENMIITAERAKITVNARFNTIAATLIDPVATTLDGGNPQELDDMTSAGVPVPYTIRN